LTFSRKNIFSVKLDCYIIPYIISALNCNDTLPKKQVVEMLSTVCVYNNIGYLRVMEGLAYVKVGVINYYVFKILIHYVIIFYHLKKIFSYPNLRTSFKTEHRHINFFIFLSERV